MATAPDFQGKIVCLVLTCRKPYYLQRLADNMDTFQRLAETPGFAVVFLYGGGAAASSQLLEREDGIYELTVPVEESYLRLASKVDFAFAYLAGSGCLGVLKLDDDTTVTNWSWVREFQTDIVRDYDYFGLAQASFEPGRHRLDYDHFRIHYLDLYWDCPEKVKFFIGSFYWVSAPLLQYIATEHLHFPLEDYNVGYLAKKFGARTGYRDWFGTGDIRWAYEREPLTVPPANPGGQARGSGAAGAAGV